MRGGKRLVSKPSIVSGTHEVAYDPKEIIDRTMDRKEALHGSLLLTCGLVRDFDAIIGALC